MDIRRSEDDRLKTLGPYWVLRFMVEMSFTSLLLFLWEPVLLVEGLLDGRGRRLLAEAHLRAFWDMLDATYSKKSAFSRRSLVW
jgi:hypothetical protein